jgi:hypothetical protein
MKRCPNPSESLLRDRLFCQVAFRAPPDDPSQDPPFQYEVGEVDRQEMCFFQDFFFFFYSSRGLFLQLTGAYFVAGWYIVEGWQAFLN